MTKYLTPAEAMKQLADAGISVSRGKFYQLLADGKLPTVKLPGLHRVFIPAAGLASLLSDDRQ
jgi:hypothetical protein